MDEIIADLKLLIKKYQEGRLTGKTAVEINYFKGGIAGYLVSEKQSKLLSKQSENKKPLTFK